MQEEIKKLLKEMHSMGSNAETCISLLQTAFIYNSSNPLKDCNEIAQSINKIEGELTKKITELARTTPDLKPYVSIPVHFLRIGENIEKLSELIDKKIKDNILFTDKAINEIIFLLERLIEILRPSSDIILAKNIILKKYIEESELDITKRATEYATLHEDRLIEGLSLPVASSIFIHMLDAIKNISWHAKEIAVKVVG